MGQWKIGYPASLNSVADEEAGKALYKGWSITPIDLSTVIPKRNGFRIISNTATNVVGSSVGMVTDEFNGGWAKIRSGYFKGEVFRIVDTTSVTLVLKKFDGSDPTFMANELVGEYIEVCTGVSTYTFPVGRNPIKEDISISTTSIMQRYPYYEGGIYIPTNFEEDIVVNGYVTDIEEYEKLVMLSKWKADYIGADSMYTNSEAAPLVLECGTHDAAHQYLVYCGEAKKIREGMKGGLIEVQLYLQQISMPTYRSW